MRSVFSGAPYCFSCSSKMPRKSAGAVSLVTPSILGMVGSFQSKRFCFYLTEARRKIRAANSLVGRLRFAAPRFTYDAERKLCKRAGFAVENVRIALLARIIPDQ